MKELSEIRKMKVIVVLVLVSAEVAGSIVEGVNLVIHGYIL
jgi:hypothetical protein